MGLVQKVSVGPVMNMEVGRQAKCGGPVMNREVGRHSVSASGICLVVRMILMYRERMEVSKC